ncbi:MAG: sigma-70 family RNA polymerase sigma factor [Mucilaginibacter sp.]|jgi:RNA polymerase sigma-70 factor (ECF subfamily)|uniref:RNA polymerase sigma factor n=1 Tax=Mucilaginibacter sp. TaxID=1882438 RepID=UPI003569F738
MQQQELIPHLFRTEFGRITAVLCKLFGFENINIAEDITSETFLAALDIWPYKGIPENPQAWLYTVAKNKAKNSLARNQLFNKKISPAIQAEHPTEDVMEIDLTDRNISDSQLQMLFAVCHPSIPPEAQIGLALRILCGFGIDEIAHAFLSNKETINKRLFRAKEKLRTEHIKMEFPAESELNSRLQNVLTTLYLLFSEGYYSETENEILRKDLCDEAIRLTKMLIDYPLTNKPEVNALFALMCFQASRFAARKDKNGEVVLYDYQDENLWDQQLITIGAMHLGIAAQGSYLSKYHLEASIAYWHTIKADTPEKWENILHLYNHLLSIEYSPVAALNRTYALAKVKGNEAAIIEAEKLNLTNNPFYHTLLGELYKGTDTLKTKEHFLNALHLAKTDTDKKTIYAKIEAL